MPTIEDLKKKNLSASISISNDIEDEVEVPTKQISTVSLSTGKETKRKNNITSSVSMLTGREAYDEIEEYNRTVDNGEVIAPAKSSNRVAANFNEIPATDGSERLGIDLRESIESDIFAKGGPFDQYVKEKTEEMIQDINERNEKAAMEAAEKEAEASSEGEEAVEEDFETTITPALNARLVDIKARKDSKENMPKIENEYTTRKVEEYENEEVDLDTEEEEDEFIDDLPIDNKVEEINETASIQNAEEIISEEPIKEEPKSNISSNVVNKITKTIVSVDEHDIFDDDDEDPVAEVTDEDDNIEALKALITKKLAPVSKKLDITTFTVAKKGTESNNIFESKEAAVAKWVLPATGVVVLLREISGSNLEMIRSMLGRRPADVRGALKIIYDHIVSPKPEKFEVWCKSIAFADYDHLFMAIYIASFVDSNFLPIDCRNEACGKTYLTEDIDIMDMVKFKDDASRDKFDNLYNSDATNSSGMYVTEIVPVSDKFAISFKEPDLFSVLIESTYFNQKDQDQYQQTIAIMPYIDTVYLIDQASRTLVPIEFKTFVNEPAKTARFKLKKLHAIINTLNVDENAILSAYTQNINDRSDWFSYKVPETTCPHCGHVNPAIEDQAASALVFLRNRLGALVTI